MIRTVTLPRNWPSYWWKINRSCLVSWNVTWATTTILEVDVEAVVTEDAAGVELLASAHAMFVVINITTVVIPLEGAVRLAVVPQPAAEVEDSLPAADSVAAELTSLAMRLGQRVITLLGKGTGCHRAPRDETGLFSRKSKNLK
jgi:hypothetical protein